MSQNNKNDTPPHINQANADISGERYKNSSLFSSKKQKNKTQNKVTDKEKKDKNSLRQFTKTNGQRQNNNTHQISWNKLKPRKDLNIKVSSFGSAHDNIFERISNRILFMCRMEKLVDCKK